MGDNVIELEREIGRSDFEADDEALDLVLAVSPYASFAASVGEGRGVMSNIAAI